jgi:hypothetical protein
VPPATNRAELDARQDVVASNPGDPNPIVYQIIASYEYRPTVEPAPKRAVTTHIEPFHAPDVKTALLPPKLSTDVTTDQLMPSELIAKRPPLMPLLPPTSHIAPFHKTKFIADALNRVFPAEEGTQVSPSKL